jgi:hypothetical protein
MVLNFRVHSVSRCYSIDEQYPSYSIPKSAWPNSVDSNGLIQYPSFSIAPLQCPESGCTVTPSAVPPPTTLGYSSIGPFRDLGSLGPWGCYSYRTRHYCLEAVWSCPCSMAQGYRLTKLR